MAVFYICSWNEIFSDVVNGVSVGYEIVSSPVMEEYFCFAVFWYFIVP